MKIRFVFRIFSVLALLSLTALACEFTITSNQFPGIAPQPTKQPTSAFVGVVPAATFQPATLLLQQPTHVSNPLITTDEEQILVDLYKSINPSVVNINTYIQSSAAEGSGALGSGFLFDLDGNIVTNSHVISGADRIEVVFSDGLIKVASVVGDDPHSDLAVINVDELPDDTFPIPLGSMDEIAVGQTAVALGNPFGLGEP